MSGVIELSMGAASSVMRRRRSARGSVGPARLGVADRVDDGVDRVLEPVAVGRDDPRVGGGRSGATARVESSSSRRRSASRIATASGPSGSRPRSSVRRRARSSTDASRKILRSASGRTTVPMSRPGHDDAAAVGQRALALEERGPQLRDRPTWRTRRRRPPGRGHPRCGRRRRRGRATGGRHRPARARPRRRGRASHAGTRPTRCGRAPATSPRGRAGPCRRTGSRPRARRPRRRCSCPTNPARRGRRRGAGGSMRPSGQDTPLTAVRGVPVPAANPANHLERSRIGRRRPARPPQRAARPRNRRLTGTSIFLPVSVRGTAGTATIVVRDVALRERRPDRRPDPCLERVVQRDAIGEDHEQRHPVAAARQLEPDDQAVADLRHGLDDAVQLARPEADALPVERRIRAAFDDRAPPLREPDPVAVAPDARDTSRNSSRGSARRRGRSRTTSGMDGSGAVSTSSPVSPMTALPAWSNASTFAPSEARLELARMDGQRRHATDERAARRRSRRSATRARRRA